ncbi:MAG TPA: thiamine pyrophosphate-binding protein, partial [Cyclobacteriaceae bacterium]|nr:thiamine pyrophosphate-binding protein [Cyclobacteriaceae bacterium]
MDALQTKVELQPGVAVDKNSGEKISGSEVLLRCLVEEGVETIFGYPGGAIMPVYDALYYYADRLSHILVR